MENGCLLIAASGSRFATRVVMGDGNRGLKATVTVGRSLRDDGIQKVDVCFQMCRCPKSGCLLSDVLPKSGCLLSDVSAFRCAFRCCILWPREYEFKDHGYMILAHGSQPLNFDKEPVLGRALARRALAGALHAKLCDLTTNISV